MSKSLKNEKFRSLLCFAGQFIIDAGLVEKNGEEHSIITDLCDKPSIIHWRKTAHGELIITVWWGFKGDSIPDSVPVILEKKKSNVTIVSVSGFLELCESPWIHGHNLNDLIKSRCYCALNHMSDLFAIPDYHGYIKKEGPSCNR